MTKKEHYRFEVLYKGILVDKHKITLHQSTDTTMLITGTTLFDNDIVTTPVLTLAQVIEKLKSNNDKITDETILSNKLVIYKALGEYPNLCYKIEIQFSLLEHYQYYVSAINGNIIWKNALIYSATPEIGVANLHNWGTQNIFTSRETINNKYILFDQIANIQTYNAKGSINVNPVENFIDLDNNWTIEEFPETEAYSKNASLVCHWGGRKTYDFFFTTFNRKGFDNKNTKLKIYVNYGGNSQGNNAAWSQSNKIIAVGNGIPNSTHHFGVVDVIAHEYGHAVTNYINEELTYFGESGAINEGLSDIWAACVENYIGASSYEIWNIGDHRGYAVRNMANPHDVDSTKTNIQPKTYGGTHWINPTSSYDKGGVHINSGVLNYWFYLLTMGGSGTNDNNEEYMVDGLGFLTSQRIVYETITTQLVENSNFAQFRSSTLAVVEDLYGDTSNAYKQVMNAWHAVGVGHPYMDSNIEGDFGICDGGVYSIEVHPAVSITWSVDKFNDIFSQKDKLTFVSGQGTNTIVVNRANRSGMSVDGNFVKYRGYVQLAANLTYGDTTITIYKTLFANNPLPEIQYTIKNQGPAIYVNNVYKFFVNNVATNFVNWKIIAGNNVYTAAATDSIVVTLPINRTYDVIVSVSDNGGCSSTNSKTLTLPKLIPPILSYENPVKRNSPLYLKKISEEPIDNSIYTIEIWNEYGLVRSEKYDDAPEFMVSTEGLIPGIYFIRIYQNEEFLDTQKLIIK